MRSVERLRWAMVVTAGVTGRIQSPTVAAAQDRGPEGQMQGGSLANGPP